MALALLCSGQGHQAPDMFDRLDGLAAAEPVFAQAAQPLGRDPRRFAREAPATALEANRAGQILCVTRALAAATVLAPSRCIVAGYSVGEMAAWGIAGLWSHEATLRLTARRAELMDTADAGGGLGFVRGLARDAVARLTVEFDCAIAIVNPGGLLIVGGARQAVAACCEEAMRRGAAKAAPIAVNVASHTPRLASAVGPLEAALREAVSSRPMPGRSVMTASTASLVHAPQDAAQGLARQVATTVDWAATLDALVERGVDAMLELGPGTALSAMVRASYPHVAARALDDFRSIDGARAWIAERGA